MRCALHNLGCKVNSYETEAMTQMLANAGYEIVEFGKTAADIYIINTCTVTNIADRKSRQMLHKAKKENPDAVVIAAGCYAQEAGNALLEDDCIDIVVGNNRKKNIVDIIAEYFANNANEDTLIDINHTDEYEKLEISESDLHTRAYIKIQDGCNQFCSYCIIPFARGRVRSRSKEDILTEVNKLAESGCKEVVVTGIHLSSYGLDFDNEEYNELYRLNKVQKNVTDIDNEKSRTFHSYRLLEVLEAISEIDGIKRIRLGSLEPRIITEEFAKRLASIDKICPHFHLSLQSGCDATLKRMNRRYDTEEYYSGVRILRNAFDRPAITTDVIVGFPGETEEEFEITEKYLEMIDFYEMHVFKYSRRKGTVADRMPNQVPDQIKTRRSNVLIALDERLSDLYRKQFIGEKEEVLVEEIIEINGREYAVGHTKRYVKVAVSIEKEAVSRTSSIEPNNVVDVNITGMFEKETLLGEII